MKINQIQEKDMTEICQAKLQNHTYQEFIKKAKRLTKLKRRLIFHFTLYPISWTARGQRSLSTQEKEASEGAGFKLGMRGLIFSTHPKETGAIKAESALFNLLPPPVGRLQNTDKQK